MDHARHRVATNQCRQAALRPRVHVCTARVRASTDMGLVKVASMPAVRQLSSCSRNELAVRATIGTVQLGAGNARMA